MDQQKHFQLLRVCEQYLGFPMTVFIFIWDPESKCEENEELLTIHLNLAYNEYFKYVLSNFSNLVSWDWMLI